MVQADLIDAVERDLQLKEDQIDFMLQTLRLIALRCTSCAHIRKL